MPADFSPSIRPTAWLPSPTAPSLNASANSSYTITVQAQDAYGGISPSATFSIAVTKAPPSTPVNLGGSATGSVLEQAADGTLVGITAYASDPEQDAITYSLTNNAGGRFAINAATGVVTVADGSLIHYSDGSYSITVEAADPAGDTASADFTVYVNSNQAGSIVVGGISITGVSANGSIVTGTAILPLLGSVTLSGTVSDNHYSFSRVVSNLNLGGLFTLASGTLTLDSSGIGLSGSVTVPELGSLQLNGSVQDATHFSLGLAQSSSQNSISFGDFALGNPTITLSQAGAGNPSATISGAATVPLFGAVAFAGTIAADGSYSVTAKPAPTGLYNGLVQLSNEALTLTPLAVTITANATIDDRLQANFQGSLFSNQTYNVTADTSLNISGYVINNATLTLADPLMLDCSLSVPQIGLVDFHGAYDATGHQWSLSGACTTPQSHRSPWDRWISPA